MAHEYTFDLIGEIGCGLNTAEMVRAHLAQAGDKPAVMRLDGPGGSVMEGMAISRAVAGHKPGVHAQILGCAASMTSVVACSAAMASMPGNGFFIVHNPRDVAGGESKDLRKKADTMDVMKSQIVDIYHAKTKLGKRELSDMMDKETWLTGKQAKEAGFVDELDEDMEMAACLKAELFDNVPEAAKALIISPTINQTKGVVTMSETKTETKTETKITEVHPKLQLFDATGKVVAEQAVPGVTSLDAYRDSLIKEVCDKGNAAAESNYANFRAQIATNAETITDLNKRLTKVTEDLTTLRASATAAANALKASEAEKTRMGNVIDKLTVATRVEGGTAKAEPKTIGEALDDIKASMPEIKGPAILTEARKRWPATFGIK